MPYILGCGDGSDYGWLTVWMLVIVARTKSLEALQQES